MKIKLAAMSLLLGAMGFAERAVAAPQDNFWLESEWATNLPFAGGCVVGISTNGQIIIGSFTNIAVFETNGTLVRSWSDGVQDLDISTNGLIYAFVGAGASAEVRVYDTFGNLVRQWMLGLTPGTSAGGPWGGIAVGRNGIVYVPDYYGARIVAYDLEGNFVRQWGSSGSLPGQFGRPRDIFATPSGNIYVGDDPIGVNDRIQVFDSEGAFKRSIPGGFFVGRIAVSPDEAVILYTPISASGDTPGAFTSDGQLRYGVYGGKVWVYRRSYSTTGLRAPNAIPVPVVARVGQRAGTTLVDIDFTVLDSDNPVVNVAAAAFVNGISNLDGMILMRTFVEGTESSVGTNVTTGVNHRLTWNAAADWSTNFVNAQIEILANDNRGLLDFHFLTIPVPTNLPALTISQLPVNDADFLNAWVWLIASGNTNVLLTNGNVMGLSGAYSGKMLTSSSGTVTTTEGRAFLFAQLNVRAATPEEYNRAKGSGVQWAPRVQLAGRPTKVNEFGFDTGAAAANNYWVVPLP